MSPASRPDENIPVPPIPQAYASVGSSHRRTASLQARGRAISPPDKKGRVRRLSVDESSGPLGAGGRGTTRAASSPDSKRPGSINFSYPMNTRPNSPRPATTARTDIYNSQESNTLSQPSVTAAKRASPTGQGQSTDVQAVDISAQDVSSHATQKNRISSGNFYESPRAETRVSRNPSQRKQGTSDVKSSRAAVDSFDLHIPKRRPSTVHEDREADVKKSQHNEQQPQRVPAIARTIVKPANFGNGPSTVWLQPRENAAPKPREVSKSRAMDSSDSSPSGQIYGHSSFDPRPQQECNGSAGVPARSTSQSRATRFSDHLQIAQPLHTPPPRSMSPAKPALKRSASHSRSPDRPLGQQMLIEVPDEPSNNSHTSVVSEKPSRTMSKKKTTRVCFEDEAGGSKDTASSNMSPVSSAPSSPEENAIPKSLRPGGGRGSLRGAKDVDELDGVLTPRPALPSFGSIRGRRGLVEETEGDKTRHETPSEGRTPVHLLFSNDHAIGGLLNESADKNSPSETQSPSNLPLPPEVTSVEGNGYDYSSSDSSDSDDTVDPGHFSPPGDELHTPPRQTLIGTDSMQKKERQHVPSLLQAVPIVSIQPATPRSEDPNPEPGDGATAASPSAMYAKVEDSDSESGESIYSDAAEDLSDLDGDGFGSINAIVDSPVSMPQRFSHASSRPNSPSAMRSNGQKPENRQLGITSDLTSWSPSSQSDASMDAPRPFTRYAVSPSEIFQTSTDPNPESRGGNIASQGNRPDGEPLRQNPARRNSPHNQVTRGIERDVSQGAQRPVSSPKQGETHRLRTPVSPSGSVVRNGGAKHPERRNTYHTELHSNQPVQRTLSNGSDSSSSFKRARRSPPGTGRYTLRRTLRSPDGHGRSFSTSAAAGTDGPCNQRQRFSPEGRQSMLRTTLRGSPISPNSAATKMSSFGLTGRPTRAGTFPRRNIFQIASPKSDTRRSRFDDSSDDELDFRPVRGIPRRAGAVDGDSTELEDSSDSNSQPNVSRRRRLSHARRPATPKAILPVIPDGKKTEEISDRNMDYFLPHNRKQRTGLLHRLNLSKRGRRNDASGIDKLELESAVRRDALLERSKLELERARLTTPSPVPTASNTDKSPSTPPKKWHSMSPKLQKRMSRRAGSGSWLFRSNDNGPGTLVDILSTNPEVDEQGITTNGKEAYRPHTSDGIVENGKPSVPNSRVNEDSTESKVVDADAPRTPLSDGGDSAIEKKRRFPLLRKALGLRK